MPKGRVPYPFGKCTVCSDQATGNHYGAVTCEGCKGFFKRSLGKAETYRCRGSNNCPVGTDSRIKCKACRFKRCKELGMSMSAIKMGRIPKAEKLRALENAYGDLAAAVAAVAGSSSSSAPSSVSTHAPMVAGATDSHSPTLSLGPSAGASVASDGASPQTTACTSVAGVEPASLATGSLADFSLQPAVVVGDCMANGTSGAADSALDLSNRSQIADRSRAFDGSRRGAPAARVTAPRPISVVNNLIAMHVLAMDGAALRDRPEGNETTSSLRPNSIAASAATGTAPQAIGSAANADAVAGSREVVRCGAPGVATSAAERRNRWHGVGSDGTSNSSSSGSRVRTLLRVPSPSVAAESCVPLPYGASRSIARASQGVAAAGSADCLNHSLGSRIDRGTPMESSDDLQSHPEDLSGRRSGSHEAGVVPRAIAEMLPDLTLSDTVSAVSSAYLKMSSATRRCIDIMSRRLAAGQVDAGLLPITADNQRYAFEQIMVSFDLLGNKIMGFIKSCPGLNSLYSEDLLALARSTYLSIWLVLESPLFRDGESHMLLPNGQRHARSWMQFYLPSDLVDRMHAYARAQVAARLTVPELGLMCSILLTSRCKQQPLSDEAAVARLNAIFTQALTYEVHRGRLHPHRILSTIWRLLAILQDVNDSHDALARLRDSDSGSAQSGDSAHSQAA